MHQTLLQELKQICADALGLVVEDVQLWDYFNRTKYAHLTELDHTVEKANLNDNQVPTEESWALAEWVWCRIYC